MTAILNFTPIFTTDDQPLCALLKVDDFTFLLDCGWNDTFNEEMLAPLKALIADVDAVLVSHPDIAHLGALPYAVGKLGLNAPIYGTVPVFKMGQMFLYDAFQSRSKYAFNTFTIDDVDKAFEKFVQLKYSQDVALLDKGAGITITPYAAGHMVGGTVWKIAKESEEIIYAVDNNRSRERHLNHTVLESFSRPTVLITDAYNALVEQAPRRQRDTHLIESLMQTLKGGGNVLLPVDTAGRVLELLLVLHSYWEFHAFGKALYPLVFLANESYYTVDFARSMIEWMADALHKQFDNNRDNPFSLKSLTICQKKEDLKKLPQPYVVLASGNSLDTSFAQDLFVEMAGNPRNLVLFTYRSPKGSLAHQLMAQPTPATVEFQHSKNVILEGAELDKYLEQKRIEKEQELLERKKELDEDSDSDTDAAHPHDATDVKSGSAKVKAEKGARSGSGSGSGASASSSSAAAGGSDMADDSKTADGGAGGRTIKASAAFPMYPYVERKRTFDLYGEVINPEDYKKETTSTSQSAKLYTKDSAAAPAAGSAAGMMRPGMSAIGAMGMAGAPLGANPMYPGGMSFNPLAGMPVPQPTFQSHSLAHAAEAAANGGAAAAAVGPSKTITESIRVPVRCAVQYIDFEGRCDGRSLKAMLTTVKPRKLILIHGSDAAKEHLREYCQKSVCRDVYVPQTNQSVDITSETNIYRVNLKDSLLSGLEFVKLGDYDIAFADGQIRIDYKQSAVPILRPAPPEKVKGHAAVFLGNLKFSDLKKLLNGNGIVADFFSGVLVCAGGVVQIKKVSATQITLTGALCDEYFKIRSLLYGKFQIL